jgi:hypothetical protein
LKTINPFLFVHLFLYLQGFQHDRVHSFIKEEPYHLLSLLGRDTEVDALFEQIQEGRLISLWGMPGVGISGLVWDIYCKHRASNNLWKHAWANVSHPFNPTDFSQNLLLNLHPGSTSSEERYSKAHQAKDPIQECRDLLQEYVYLVVIDGLQFEEDWDWIKSNLIGNGGSRSCIITITPEESVGKHCAVSTNNSVVHNIKGLDADADFELFKKVCFLTSIVPFSFHLYLLA